jgi:iron complex outermembrane recepter protein
LGNAQGTIDATPVADGAKYTQLLPSLNLNFQVADDQVVRFATSKTQSRSRIDDLSPDAQISFNFDTAHRTSADPKFSAWGGSTGTTQLKPSQDVQYDLAYEWYFAEDGLLSASYFYKDLQTWNVTGQTVTDFTPYFVAGYHDKDLPAGTFKSYSGISSVKSSAGYGAVQGTEYQANIPLHIVSDYLDGFGVIASAAFMDGHVTDPVNKQVTSVPGMSKETYQLTVYFEHAGFEARVAARKRDKYLSEAPGLSLALTPFTDNGATLIDAQIGYDFKDSGIASLEGLTITLQAQNLTNEPTKLTEASDSRMVDQYSNFGANYLLGFNYKFR